MNTPSILLVAALLTAQAAPAQDPAATVSAARALVNEQSWTDLDARLAAIPPDDAAWERLPAVVYSAGIARNDLPGVVDRLTRLAAATTSPSIKASALIVIGRAHRRQGDMDAATKALERAKAAAPGSSYAEDAAGLIYEIRYVRPGLTAPSIVTTARDGRAFDLATLRGKPAVLVFWGTT